MKHQEVKPMQIKYIAVQNCAERFSDDYDQYWYFKQVFDSADYFTLTSVRESGGGTSNNGTTSLTYRSCNGLEVSLWIDGGFPVPELAVFDMLVNVPDNGSISELVSAFDKYHNRKFRYTLSENRLELYPNQK